MSPEFFALQEAVAGRYSLERELGRGGMGVVFLARDVALDRPVAIKLLPPALAAAQSMRARFLREARAAARLSHPHIVPVHAVEAHDALAFFVMAYVDGETLGERVRRAGPLPAHEATRVMQEVAWALAHAHAHGIAHRDVKPDNVMLERATGRALVADFGIARVADAPETPTAGTPLGTPLFTSPEQATGEAGDARSDCYSLGATMYFALSGRAPFEANTALALLARHATVDATPLAAARSGLPERLARLVDSCLAKNPAARPTAEAIADALTRARSTLGEVAPAMRAYLRESEAALGDTGAALLGTGVTAAVLFAPGSGDLGSIFAGLAYAGVAGIALSLAIVRSAQWVRGTRAVVREGYDQEGARSAVALVESERAEEAAGASPRGRPWLRVGVGAAVSAAAVWVSQWEAGTGSALDNVSFFGVVLAPTITLRALWGAARRGPPLWARVVGGALGRWTFRAAGLGLPRPVRAALSGEPTALLLERAAEELYAALPAGEQATFRDIPDVAARLRADALAAREAPAGSPAAERGTSAVAALEALRLDLLRIHAGAAAPDLTRHLDDARRIGERIDRVGDAGSD